MKTVLRHLRAQSVAYIALFIALGGTGYAAINLPANSVGTRQLRRGAVGSNQLRNHSVTPVKLANGPIAGYIRAYASVDGQGQILASHPAAELIDWRTTGSAPGGVLQFSQSMPTSCFALATMEGGPHAIYASAQLTGGAGHGGAVAVNIVQPQTTGNVFLPVVHVAVVCPEP